jgi:ATP-dependent Clp protease adaptor protein ClpS
MKFPVLSSKRRAVCLIIPENAELAPLRENSAADRPLRQQPRPRACVRLLDGKGFMPQWPPTLRVGRSEVSSNLEKDEVKAKRPSMWNIVFYNDDYTPIDFVVFVVTKVFHRSPEDALALTLAVHTQGKGIAGTYTFEVAEQKQYEVLLMAKIEEHPLRVEVERV